MHKRFLSIWFRYLKTDWVSNRLPGFKQVPLILSSAVHGRMIVAAVNQHAAQYGIYNGMVVADARAICTGIQVTNDIPLLEKKLLQSFAVWCIRFTPVAAIDMPDGIMLDITGCAHLWGGEENYTSDIVSRLQQLGYTVQIGLGNTIGTAWAMARYGNITSALSSLPSAALRLDPDTVESLEKLGLKRIGQFMHMPRHALRRRFGPQLLLRLDQALGKEEEIIHPVIPVAPYHERLPCLEPIATPVGLSIALEKLLHQICARLQKDGKGLRQARFACYRVDNNVRQVVIGTHRPSQNPKHIFRLFEEKIQTIEPGPGIELFTLDAPQTEDVSPLQEKLWESNYGLESIAIAELIDRIAGKIGAKNIRRFLPAEHYWPERSVRQAAALTEKATTAWSINKPRPLQLLAVPQSIEVSAPIPDYPPMLFRYKGQLHTIKKADGPERIEQEWWLQQGEHRDYYVVEDDTGNRYWLFRLGHYDPDKNNQWFLHGYFA